MKLLWFYSLLSNNANRVDVVYHRVLFFWIHMKDIRIDIVLCKASFNEIHEPIFVASGNKSWRQSTNWLWSGGFAICWSIVGQNQLFRIVQPFQMFQYIIYVLTSLFRKLLHIRDSSIFHQLTTKIIKDENAFCLIVWQHPYIYVIDFKNLR